MGKIIITSFLCLILCYSSQANIINVPGVYSAIQDAINASVNGDTVLVEPNTYYENINFRGKNIVLTGRFYLTNNPSDIWATVINGSTPSQPDSGSCVIINNNEDSTAVLQGFTLTGGTGTKWQDEHGAGRYREGGGILIQYSAPIIQFNIIHDNRVTDVSGVVSTGGGGIRVGDSYPRIYNNIIMNNTGRYGAGVVLNFTGGELKNNVICVNYGSYQYGAGSGIWLNGSFSRPRLIINNTIASNTATSGTPGIYGYGNVQGTFISNIVWGNSAPSGLQISGGNFTFTYCDIQDGYTGAGNINELPQFADSNYYLLPGSPCIDMGDSNSIYNDTEDPNNPGYALYPAMGTLRNDIGAYGGPLAKILSNVLIGIAGKGKNIPGSFMLFQNYPNPFNPETKIRFVIPSRSGIVKLTVYDVLGKKVTELVHGDLPPGTYETVWNASGFSSGVYFYTLKTESFSQTGKMVLTK